MDYITSKADVKGIIARAVLHDDLSDIVNSVDDNLLKCKVKFPLLEFAAKELFRNIPPGMHVAFTDSIIERKTIGGNVLAGIILQLRIPAHFMESLNKAAEYIKAGNEWYVCDIIGERVYGHALLILPGKTIPELYKMSKHEDKWIVRAVGVATHYAVKKGLGKHDVSEMFGLLLSLSNTTEFHTKKGVGWAAKTIAKFHPDIIEKYNSELESDEVRQWFKTKIKIGLSRTGKYAGRYTG